MATFTTIRAAIKSKLEGISNLVAVFDTHESDLTGYPSATFDVSESASDFEDNRNNLRTITYKIWIYQETYIKGYDAGSNILDATSDAVITALENDFSLGGVVDWCEPTVGPREQVQSPNGLVIRQELILKCKYLAPLTF